MAFQDHFAPVAGDYADFRPHYPSELFAWLADQTPGRDLAWDCACGSGQASAGLSGCFRRVLASDASASQIAAAPALPGVEFRVAPAEASGLPAASVDLICVAQALHWFDLPGFYAEVRRVLKPDGLLAVWTYGILHVAGETVDAPVQHFYHQVVGPYWPPERRHVETGYRELPFPFTEIPSPSIAMTADWTPRQLLGYLASWSATGRYRAQRGHDPITDLANALSPLWGDPAQARRVEWPLALRLGRLASRF